MILLLRTKYFFSRHKIKKRTVAEKKCLGKLMQPELNLKQTNTLKSRKKTNDSFVLLIEICNLRIFFFFKHFKSFPNQE